MSTNREEDGSRDLDAFLKSEGLHCEKDSPAYQKLRDLFRLAVLENTQRTIDRVSGRGANSHRPLFSDVFAHTRLETRITLSELVKRHKQSLIDTRSSGQSVPPCRQYLDFILSCSAW